MDFVKVGTVIAKSISLFTPDFKDGSVRVITHSKITLETRCSPPFVQVGLNGCPGSVAFIESFDRISP